MLITSVLTAQQSPPPHGPAEVEGHDAIEQFMVHIAPAVARARETWPSIRDRFLAGLADGERLSVLTFLKDDAGISEAIDLSVDRIAGGLIHGHIVSVVTAVQGYSEGDIFALPEELLFDWTLMFADGTGEGNFVGELLSRPE